MEEERDKGKRKEIKKKRQHEERKKDTNKQRNKERKAVPCVRYYVRHSPCSSPRSEER